MSDEQLHSLGGKSFEAMKMTNEHGADFWMPVTSKPCSATTNGATSTGRSRKPKLLAISRVTTATIILPASAK